MKKIHQKSTFIHLGNKTKCIINYEVIDSRSKEVLFKRKATGISICAPEDKYNRLLGERIAESKATIKMNSAIGVWTDKMQNRLNIEFNDFSRLSWKAHFTIEAEKNRLENNLYNL